LSGLAGAPGVVPIVAKGAASQTANLQQWENVCSTPLSVMNSSGWLGVGTASVPTTLAIGGSMSARTVFPTTCYSMDPSGKPPDFVVLANASTASFAVTLPNASTATGRIVFLKRIDANASTSVKVKAQSTDKIDGKSSSKLAKPYDTLTLISDGNSPGNWYILSNSS